MNLIKKYNIYFTAIFFCQFLTSCEAQKNTVEIDLKICVNEKVNTHIKEFYGKEPFDFYEFIIEIETKLKKDKLIVNNKKENYLSLINSIVATSDINNYKIFYDWQNKLIEDYGFKPFSTLSIFNICPAQIVDDNNEGIRERDLIYNQGVVLNKLMANGFNDKQLIHELLEIIPDKEFNKIVYRAPVILLAMINIDLIFNPQIPMEKFEVNGKTYFRPKNEIEKK